MPQPIDVKVFGEDQTILQDTARRVAAVVSRVPGVEDVFDGITIAGPALRLETRRAELARRGLSTVDLQREVEAATVGTVAGDLRIGERVYDVRVFSGPGGATETSGRSRSKPAAASGSRSPTSPG